MQLFTGTGPSPAIEAVLYLCGHARKRQHPRPPAHCSSRLPPNPTACRARLPLSEKHRVESPSPRKQRAYQDKALTIFIYSRGIRYAGHMTLLGMLEYCHYSDATDQQSHLLGDLSSLPACKS